MSLALGIRKGRGKAKKSLDLIDAVIRIFERIQPASVRAACYQLFIEGYIDSMSRANTNAVGKQIVWAREEGLLPWEWVVDETREAERVKTWADPDSIIDAAVRGYRRDYWQDQPTRLELFTEKSTVRGTISPILKKYGVTVRVMHGYGSATALHDVAEESLESEKPLTILYIGDWDPSGLHMSEIDLPGRLARYSGEALIHRIALDRGDLSGLPSFEADSKSKDPRHKWYVEKYGQRCWELDAMPPPLLRARVELEIYMRLDQAAWAHAVKIETAEVESMKSILVDWNNSKSVQASKYPGGDV